MGGFFSDGSLKPGLFGALGALVTCDTVITGAAAALTPILSAL
jgi:hypothetical protein